MYLRCLLFFICFRHGISSSMFYDSYRGSPITMKELKRHDKANTTYWCVNEVEPCDKYEGRRIDGTCNNLKHPTRGASHTPMYNVLPPTFGPGNQPRPSKAGGKMPLERPVRMNMLAEGKATDPRFTQLISYLLAFVASDITSLHDTVNYILWKPYCCLPKGRKDPQCYPIDVPSDDPVHQFSDIRCLNLTRPITFQTCGCLDKGSAPERITSSTTLFDLSVIYGNTRQESDAKGRLFRRGLLKYETDDAGRIWPPSTKTPVDLCLLNEKPLETRCHDGPGIGMNSLLGVNVMSIWFWREHNRIAEQLSEINPCWDDEKLFYYARDINIATFLQILFYEAFPALLGRSNLIRDSIISSTTDFRDIYNDQVIPQISSEFLFAFRWAHTLQEGSVKLYKPNGKMVGECSITKLTLRTGYLGVGDNLEQITQGCFRQAGGKIDYIIDPDMGQLALGPHQRSSDVATSDLAKNRLAGLPPYVAYLEFCRGRSYGSFDDLLDVIDSERLERLKEKYENFEDIDLMAGLWSEKLVKGGHVPITFYCLVVEQLTRSVVSDRHWYERAERPNAFSAHQLREVRNASMARILCDNGDTVTEIQPQAFKGISPGNEMVRCEKIQSINLIAWKDYSCQAQRGYHK